jgi:hypothetical protein
LVPARRPSLLAPSRRSRRVSPPPAPRLPRLGLRRTPPPRPLLARAASRRRTPRSRA